MPDPSGVREAALRLCEAVEDVTVNGGLRDLWSPSAALRAALAAEPECHHSGGSREDCAICTPLAVEPEPTPEAQGGLSGTHYDAPSPDRERLAERLVRMASLLNTEDYYDREDGDVLDLRAAARLLRAPWDRERLAQALLSVLGHTDHCRTVDAELDDALASAPVDYDEPPPIVKRCSGACRFTDADAILAAMGAFPGRWRRC